MAKKRRKKLSTPKEPAPDRSRTKQVPLRAAKSSVVHKVPEESPDYPECSAFVIDRIGRVIQQAIDAKANQIFIHTNLKRGLPLENINKVAGPFIEAWALEKFEDIADSTGNTYDLVNVEAGKRLDPYDIILQFKRKRPTAEFISANVDVKATAEDIISSGKSPNITS